MKKLNLICAAIAALAAGVASAGTAVSTANRIAVENFGGATSSATQTTRGAPISYSMTNITAVNALSTVYFTVRLTGGKFAGTPASGDFTFAGTRCGTGTVTCAVTPSTDRSTIKIAVSTGGTSFTLGLGAFTWAPDVADIDSVNTTLGTAGGKVTASIGLVSLNPTAIEATDTQATIDAPLATGDLAVAAQGITSSVSASTYAGQIDLTATPAASAYTTTNAVLGAFKFTDATTAAKIADNSGSFVLGPLTAGTTTVTVTPGASQVFPVGAVLTLNDAVSCAGTTISAAPVTVTSGNAAAAKTLTTTTTLATGIDYFVCMTAPSATNVASPIQAGITATLVPTTTTRSVAAASGTGYNFGYNGSTVDIASYWPGGLARFNFNGYVRITNTGQVAAPISAQHFTTAGALTGTSTVLAVAKLPTGTLAAGQSVLIPTDQIDTLIGAAPSNLESGRIRITAPTNGLRVQSMLQSPDGTLVEYKNPAVTCTVSGGGGTIAAVAGGNGTVALGSGVIAGGNVDTTATPGAVNALTGTVTLGTGAITGGGVTGGGGTVAAVTTSCVTSSN